MATSDAMVGVGVVEPVRPDVRRRNSQESGSAHAGLHSLEVASGRGLREGGRRDALPLARCRPRGRGAGILCHQERDKAAALKFIKEARSATVGRAAIVTDGLRSYGAALKEIGAAYRQETGRWLNSRAENSHLPFRRRESAMGRFRRMKTLQKFSSVHAQVHNHFSQERHLISRDLYRQRRSAALAEWRAVMG